MPSPGPPRDDPLPGWGFRSWEGPWSPRGYFSLRIESTAWISAPSSTQPGQLPPQPSEVCGETWAQWVGHRAWDTPASQQPWSSLPSRVSQRGLPVQPWYSFLHRGFSLEPPGASLVLGWGPEGVGSTGWTLGQEESRRWERHRGPCACSMAIPTGAQSQPKPRGPGGFLDKA